MGFRGLGFRVEGSGFRGLWFRVEGFFGFMLPDLQLTVTDSEPPASPSRINVAYIP